MFRVMSYPAHRKLRTSVYGRYPDKKVLQSQESGYRVKGGYYATQLKPVDERVFVSENWRSTLNTLVDK